MPARKRENTSLLLILDRLFRQLPLWSKLTGNLPALLFIASIFYRFSDRRFEITRQSLYLMIFVVLLLQIPNSISLLPRWMPYLVFFPFIMITATAFFPEIMAALSG